MLRGYEGPVLSETIATIGNQALNFIVKYPNIILYIRPEVIKKCMEMKLTRS